MLQELLVLRIHTNKYLSFTIKNTIALQEQFIIIYLNRANQVLGAYHAFTGGITGTVADIRIIMGVALKSMACGIVISHNHPYGSLIPSNADRMLTNNIKEYIKMKAGLVLVIG